jgi:hypothetical protein
MSDFFIIGKRVAMVVVVLLCAGGRLIALSTGVHGNIQDAGIPAEALVSLAQLPDESCANLFSGDKKSSTDPLKEAESCRGPEQNVKAKGRYEFAGLQPGWYILRFRWVMKQPPDSKKPVGCNVQGWSISYVPLKEAGKYRGFAQSPPFRLADGELKNLDFNYDGDFKIQKGCANPITWQKR